MASPKNYEVGYCKPPAHTRFQKGQSGNPKGRPKGSLNLVDALERELRTLVTVKEGGRTRTITKFEAATKQLVNKAASGDARALQMLLGFLNASMGSAPDGVAPVLAQDADRIVLATLLQRFQPEPPTTPEPLEGAQS